MSDEYKRRTTKKAPKYTRGSAAQSSTIPRRIYKSVKFNDTVDAPASRKRIMIKCPVCLETFVLTGKDRAQYLKKVQRNEYKLGKPCSDACKKAIAIPATRMKLKPTFDMIREIAPLKKKSPGRPKGSKERIEYVEPLGMRELRENAAID